MKKFKTIIFSSVHFLASGITLYAQQGASTAGGDAFGAGGNVSYTFGQIDYINTTGSGGVITQGIQQPYEILVTTGIDEKGIDLSASVYPNPTTDFVLLKIENNKVENFNFQRCDNQGKILLNKKVESNETNIFTTDLACSIYFIKVLKNNVEVKAFKIIKN